RAYPHHRRSQSQAGTPRNARRDAPRLQLPAALRHRGMAGGASGGRRLVMAANCLICERVALARAGENPYLIAEFEHTIFVVGDHQYHRGYSLLLLKDHVHELHTLAPDVQTAMFQELMTATRALV